MKIDNLCDETQISISLKGLLSPKEIIELAQSGYMPNYYIGEKVLFNKTECKEWVEKNKLQRCFGKPMSVNIVVSNDAPEIFNKPPISIENLDLKEFRGQQYRPGIYFLCDGPDVVYVGQSTNPAARIPQHFGYKTFDRSYILHVPKSDLDRIETEFILLLKPRLQGRNKNDTFVVPMSQQKRGVQ